MPANLIIRCAVPAAIALLLASCGGSDSQVKTAARECVEKMYANRAEKFDDFSFDLKPVALDEASKKNDIKWAGYVIAKFAYMPRGGRSWAQGNEPIELYVEGSSIKFNPTSTGRDPCVDRL